ncbi:MAG: hypothetical protein KatS3mg131_0251 [Candidatus Tectimicrobiota bacterium]|nr:MAG: hypothetical protein KatS3mg131_0251 [Candidatus Tectomicrobia bacterium]
MMRIFWIDSPEEQLLDQKAGHDGLACPRVVGEQEPDSRKGEEIAIDRLDLVRKRIDDAGVDREKRVELVRDADALRLGAEEEELGIAIERMLLAPHLDERGQLLSGEGPLHHPAGLEPDPFDQRLVAEGGDTPNLDQLGGFQARDHVCPERDVDRSASSPEKPSHCGRSSFSHHGEQEAERPAARVDTIAGIHAPAQSIRSLPKVDPEADVGVRIPSRWRSRSPCFLDHPQPPD